MNMLSFAISLFDPVPQDPNAVLYALVDGVHHRMRPKTDKNGRITEWRYGDVVLRKRSLTQRFMGLLDPIPQNPNEVRLSWDAGMARLRPVFDRSGSIVDWIEDPDTTELVRLAIAAEAAAHPPPTLPGDPTPPDPQQGDGTDDGFNPFGVNGL